MGRRHRREPAAIRLGIEPFPEGQGIDSAKLAEMLAFVLDQSFTLQGVLVVRHGRLVLEAYAPPFGPGARHQTNDVVNSLVSALIGIAISEGHLTGVDQELSSLFPASDLGRGMGEVTIRNLLTMSSGAGLPCEGPVGSEADWLRSVLLTPREDPPEPSASARSTRTWRRPPWCAPPGSRS